jgi:hypothetical protein
MADIDTAVRASEEVVQLSGPGTLDRPTALFDLSQVLGTRFQTTDLIDDLNLGIRILEELLNLTVADSSHRAEGLSQLGWALQARFARMGLIDDINGSIEAFRETTRVMSIDDKQLPNNLSHLGVALQTRFEQTEDLTDLDDAMRASEDAIKSIKKQNQDESRLEDIAAILEMETPITSTVENQEDQIIFAINLKNSLVRRFEQTRRMGDIDAIIQVSKDILTLMPKQRHDRMDCLNYLDTALQERFQAFSCKADLKATVTVNKEKVKVAVEDECRSTSLNNVAALCFQLYQRTGSLSSLNDAVEACTETIKLTSKEDPEDVIILGTLLIARFQLTASMEDLSWAVDVSKKAENMTAEDGANREPHRNATANLGIALLKRYEQSGSVGDLDFAVKLHEKALKLTPDSDSASAFRRIQIAQCT